MAVVSTGTAFAGSEQPVTGPSRPVYSTLQTRDTGSEAYPTFKGASLQARSNGAARVGASQDYEDFAGQTALGDGGEPRFASSAPLGLRFELIGQPRKNGGIGKMHSADSESLVFVRLVWADNGAPITSAKVALLRVDMAPDGMPEMTARSYIRPYGDPGIYRVEIHPLMAGRWAVTLEGHMSDHPVSTRQTLTVALAK
jgi:hypothetical protein